MVGTLHTKSVGPLIHPSPIIKHSTVLTTWVLLHGRLVHLRLLNDHDTPGLQSYSRLQHADHMVDVLLHGLLKQTEANT